MSIGVGIYSRPLEIVNQILNFTKFSQRDVVALGHKNQIVYYYPLAYCTCRVRITIKARILIKTVWNLLAVFVITY
jgi:hypothetical protein